MWRKAIGSMAVGTVCLAVIGGLTSCGGGSTAEHVLHLPHVLNTDHPVHKALVKFADEVEERSEGEMVIKIHPGGTLGNEQELVDNVSNDTDAFTKVSTTILETKTDLAKIYSLPYLFRSSEHMWQVLKGEIGQELLNMAIDQNLKGICYFDAGARSFYTKKKVTGPKDLQGMKIRVQKSVMMQKLVESLGASPQQIAFSELYTALDSGVVAGAENNIPSYYTTQHYKVAPYYVFDEHVRIPDILVMSAKRWRGLTSEEQKIIEEAADVAVEYQRELWQKERRQQMKAMRKAGVTFTRPDKKPFIEATKSIYKQFEGEDVMDYVERIRKVKVEKGQADETKEE